MRIHSILLAKYQCKVESHDLDEVVQLKIFFRPSIDPINLDLEDYKITKEFKTLELTRNFWQNKISGFFPHLS